MGWQITGNEVMYSVLLAFLLAQGAKVINYTIKQGFHMKDFWVTGGMPSSHTSSVVALTFSILMAEGASSLFVATFVLMAIVIRDAMGVRRTVGEQGNLLFKLIQKSKLATPKLHFALGHKPKEVLVGAVLGIMSVLLIFSSTLL